jgi:Ca2+-binding RTX toxin-like protein
MSTIASVKVWATGNDQTLTGGAGNDTLRGYTDDTVLIGGSGNDTYILGSIKNVVVEAAGGGIDTITTYGNYTLGDNLENLNLGQVSTYGIGNSLDNVITGSAGSQQLAGLAGNDKLTGGDGSDVFIVSATDNGNDVITDFQAGTGGDKVRLPGNSYTNFDQVVANMAQVGSDVVLDLGGGSSMKFLNHKISDFSKDDFGYAFDKSNLKLSFQDEFNTLSLQADGGTWRTSYDAAGVARSLPTNGEQEIYMDQKYLGLGVNPFSLDDGVLTISGAKASAEVKAATGYDYTSGMLSSKGKFAQTYGYFEIRCELPSGQGNWPAFWLLPADGSWPPELDVFEVLGNDSSAVYTTAHSKATGSHTGSGISSWAGDLSEGMHTYGVLWTKDELVWYVDGAEVFRTETPADMNKPMYLVTNLALGGGWPGKMADDYTGSEMQIDYIRAYTLDGDSTSTGGTTGGTGGTSGGTSGNTSGDTSGSTTPPPAGNAALATVNGTCGNDVLCNKAGAARLIGGTGNDTYYVNSASDIVTESSGEGTDSVYASISYTLTGNVENLTLNGTAAISGTGNDLGNYLTGNAANNTLVGLGGNDVLNGGAGADKMIGGVGNDIYLVDNIGDVVVENAGEGTDSVTASVTYTLSANVENLTLSGSATINGTGNDLNNVISGNCADNVLSGGAGNDVLYGGAGKDVMNGGTGSDAMLGGAGNDTYYVDDAKDTVVEKAGEGTDTVFSSVSFTLGANIENLTLTGTASINGTGNDLGNYLTGNSGSNVLTGGAGNDVLNGGGGADKMIGGAGNDIYLVDNTADLVVETATGGTDSVMSSVTFTLSANVENLTLTGTGAISGTGNNLANVITGNAGNNVLSGGGGSDILYGGGGNDVMTGGSGADIFYAAKGSSLLTITDFGAGKERDKLNVSAFGAQAKSATLSQQNDGTRMVFGSGEQVMLAGVKVEDLKYSDGYYYFGG